MPLRGREISPRIRGCIYFSKTISLSDLFGFAISIQLAAQREFDRDGAAGVDRVDRRRVVDRLEEAAEVIARRLAAKGSQIYRY
jgi:hypothetical protein